MAAWITRRGAILGGALLAAPAIARAQGARALRFGHVQPPEGEINRGILRAAELLRERSGGRLRIDNFPSSQLGGERDMLSQVSSGTLDLCITGPGVLGSWVRPLSILESPFLTSDFAQLQKMFEHPAVQAMRRQLAEQRSMRVLGPWYYGTRHLTTRDRPVRQPEDLKGLKIRVPEAPLFLDMMRTLGAAPTPMSLGEVYLSLQTGVIDGQENPLPTIAANKFMEVQKYVNLTGHILVPLVPVLSEQSWTALPPADRELLIAALAEGGALGGQLTRESEQRLRGEFEARGTSFIDSDRPAFQRALAPMFARYEEVWGRGVHAALQAL
ncbi:sialic acid TRAP transporter substrate-binding protein SiaP [Belnapia sp. T6]|uniref:Sialic acid TRAP transporter substrate-binding protein SiaP n=1 Tax=Belnapia mucosa TaxID=2804532 RepID=A0ABS1VAC7_9PROT|nr:sialic acid TRAP transporter substrate-binding protein SiaP [Belnapia mucosa]MBL6458592.1 sialic acid TRAP transporter substrate-binding protein SiaP [Belnapia mucosa]